MKVKNTAELYKKKVCFKRYYTYAWRP